VLLRFFIDPATGEPHIAGHNVSEQEVEDVLGRPLEDRPGSEGSRVALGQTEAGRYLKGHLRARSRAEFGVRHHGVRTGSEGTEGAAAPTEEIMKPTKYPEGWDEARVRRVLAHYEEQTDEEAVAEDEAAYESTTHTVMEVPVELVPEVRELLAKRRAS
jgi:hypothetical protein